MGKTPWLMAVLVTGALAAATTSAQIGSRAPANASTPSPSADGGIIIGTARDAGDRLLPDTRVQLRNLRSGNLEQFTTTDGTGAFRFVRVPAGVYVVEMTLSSGAVVAIGDTLTLLGAETLQTMVQAPARARSFAWWLGSTTTAALAQAASLGVLAVDTGTPVSPQ